MARIKSSATPTDELDRDVAAVVASIRRLTKHLEAEPDIAIRAASVLLKVGPYAAGPIAAALGRSRSPQRKVLMIRLLSHLGQQARTTVERALLEVLKSEKDPVVRQHAWAANAALIVRDFQGTDAGGPARGERGV